MSAAPASADCSVVCYVALGSNLGDSRSTINHAIAALKTHPNINALSASKVYQSKPHGPQNQADYLNAAVKFSTNLEPEALLDVLQRIENDHHRVRAGVERWGARTLDLDLLFYGDQTINTPRLTVPHPRICERAFVLLPLRDLSQHTPNESEPASCLKINPHTTILDCIEQLPAAELNNIKELSDG